MTATCEDTSSGMVIHLDQVGLTDRITVERVVLVGESHSTVRGQVIISWDALCPHCGEVPSSWRLPADYTLTWLLCGETSAQCGACTHTQILKQRPA